MPPQHYTLQTTNTRQSNKDFHVFFTLAFVVFLLCLFAYILLTINRLLPIKEIEKRAFEESDFQQTEYWIYDRGGQSANCDRLIIVKPFEWYLLNTNKQLFLIDPERPINCGANKVSALRILRDSLIECCLDLSFDSLLQLYDRKDSVPFVRIPFTIRGDRFTIYTAINELAHNYLDFEPNPKSLHSFAKLENIYSIHDRGWNLTGLLTSRFVRSLDSDEDNDDDNDADNDDNSVQNDDNSANRNTSNKLSGTGRKRRATPQRHITAHHLEQRSKTLFVPTLVEADRIRERLHAAPTKEEIQLREILDADDREIEILRLRPYDEKEAWQRH